MESQPDTIDLGQVLKKLQVKISDIMLTNAILEVQLDMLQQKIQHKGE